MILGTDCIHSSRLFETSGYPFRTVTFEQYGQESLPVLYRQRSNTIAMGSSRADDMGVVDRMCRSLISECPERKTSEVNKWIGSQLCRKREIATLELWDR